jgi:TRAP-type C4-dicarboxylate transport system permease small subunit
MSTRTRTRNYDPDPEFALTRFTRRVNRVFLAFAGLLAAAILLALSYDLVARNVFDAPTLWALDISRFLLLFLFFFALAPALESGAHVSVDILEHYLGPRARRLLRIVARLLVLLFGVFLMWQICRTTYEAFVENSLFPTVVPVRLKHVYWIAPIGVLQFLLTAAALLGEDLRWKG